MLWVCMWCTVGSEFCSLKKYNAGMFAAASPGRDGSSRAGFPWLAGVHPGQAGPAMRPREQAGGLIKGLQDIVNRRKAKHKGKHLLLKEEEDRET